MGTVRDHGQQYPFQGARDQTAATRTAPDLRASPSKEGRAVSANTARRGSQKRFHQLVCVACALGICVKPCSPDLSPAKKACTVGGVPGVLRVIVSLEGL